MSQDNYYIIFDTNTLYVNYKSYGDFIGFSFNATFDNVISFIEKFDMYEHITILVPTVAYEEIKRHKIDAHNDKKEILQKAVEKSKFPGFSYTLDDIDYDKYISDKIIEYQRKLASNQISITDLPLPTEKRFASITNRAFAKQPPFLGVGKESDKGFKDALIWESILELKEKNSQAKIIFYSKDNGFCDILTDEFQEAFDDQIFICKDENQVENQLKIWAKTIDEFVHIPEDDSEKEKEERKLLEWFDSEEFFKQLAGFSNEFKECSDNIFLSKFSVYNIESVDQHIESEIETFYDVTVNVHITFIVKDGERIIGDFQREQIVTIGITGYDEMIFSINYVDVYEDEEE